MTTGRTMYQHSAPFGIHRGIFRSASRGRELIHDLIMTHRERRSVSLGRHRDRGSRDHTKPIEEDLSTRHNISNFLLTLQRIQASEEENRLLRKENDLLRQRTRSYRMSSASSSDQTTILPDAGDEIIAADVKRNSLIFVGESSPTSPEHAALEAQYNKLQEDFKMVKDFLKHLFQHALAIPSSDGYENSYKDGKDKENADINTYNPLKSKQLERSLEDIHGQISQLRNSQEHQQVKMEQVQQALDNVLCQSSVRNDVTMRIVRQQDKVKELTRFSNFLEAQLMALSISLRQAEEKVRQTAEMGQTLNNFALTNSKHFKGNTKDEICRVAEQLTYLGQRKSSCACKIAAINKLVNHLTLAANQRQTLIDSKPPADVIDAMSKLERLIGSDWHRLGRMLGLNPDCLDDIGKFTNFDLTSRAEKVITTWARQTRGANTEGLKQGLDKMDRDILLITEQPMCKDWLQLPPEVHTYVIAHVINVLSIVSQLSSQGILSQDSRAFILDAAQEHRRAGRMLQSVVYMGPPALCELCTALDSHNQSLVASKIRGSFSSNMLNNSSVTTSQMSDHSNKSALSIDILHSCVAQSSAKPSSKLSSSTKPGEKPRKKRSRSLFSRKNKLRDNEVESESAVDAQDEYNYYYPAANLNAVSVADARENHAKLEDLPPPGPSRRHFDRQVRSNQVSNSSKEVIV